MKEVYLIRHTTPAVAKGICYGQTDLDVTETFEAEARVIEGVLPGGFEGIYSSPLRRCSFLAARLFPSYAVSHHDDLMEIHCGEWEMKAWDDIPKELIDPWMKDFVNIRTPGGESYLDLHDRVTRRFSAVAGGGSAVAIVAHGGVIRSILSHITGTPLIESFKVFPLYYGCVVRIYGEPGQWRYEMLSNIAPAEKEQHKPKSFY